jgi:hypothetical protein
MEAYITRRSFVQNINDVPIGTIYNVFTKIDEINYKIQLFKKNSDNDGLSEELTLNVTSFDKGEVYDFYSLKLNGIIKSKQIYSMYQQQLFGDIACSFYIPNNINNECIMLLRVPTYFVGITPYIVEDDVKFKDVVVNKHPEYEFVQAKLDAKKKLVHKLSALDSLSYMEAQLDFVTKILFAIIEKEPYLKQHALEAIQQYSNFKSAFEENSVFTIKDEIKCFEEILNVKKNVRGVQSEYYQEKAEIEKKEIDGDNNGI